MSRSNRRGPAYIPIYPPVLATRIVQGAPDPPRRSSSTERGPSLVVSSPPFLDSLSTLSPSLSSAASSLFLFLLHRFSRFYLLFLTLARFCLISTFARRLLRSSPRFWPTFIPSAYPVPRRSLRAWICNAVRVADPLRSRLGRIF